MISYSQNFEDVILNRCFSDRKDGFYIDVGAMDPVFDSVTKCFYDQGWSGINIEPNGFFHAKLTEGRPRDINLNLAVSGAPGSRLFYEFEQYGISTFDPIQRDRFLEKGFEVKEKTVPVATLSAICNEYVKREIDFLKVDCEGWEKFVLEGADWERFRPIIIIVEATEPLSRAPSWSEWEPLLTNSGRYEMVYFDGLNRFYLRSEYLNLRCHFETPPNIFDGFVPYALEQVRQQSEHLKRERDGLGAQLICSEENQKKTEATSNTLTSECNQLRDERDELRGECDRLVARASQRDTQFAEDRQLIEDLQHQLQGLEQKLLQSRLWVGQLSQDLVMLRQQSS